MPEIKKYIVVVWPHGSHSDNGLEVTVDATGEGEAIEKVRESLFFQVNDIL